MAALKRFFKRLPPIKESAKPGDKEAQYRRGLSYYDGDGVTQSDDKAARCFLEAAVQGHPDARRMLGLCYHCGIGVPKDFEQAALWFKRAADVGNAEAQFNLGCLYVSGEGVSKSFEEAALWFKKAADVGHSVAAYNLGVLYGNGQGVKKSFEEAARWFRKAADQGNADAQERLGFNYYQGQGVGQSFEEAGWWLKKAADQGNVSAQSNLGHLYSNGQGVVQSFEEAARWVRKAADQGHAAAQSNLGELYAEGLGVEQSWDQAFSWYEAASKQGQPAACLCLAWLLWTGTGGVQKDRARAGGLCAYVRKMGESAEEVFKTAIPHGKFWPTTLAWYREMSTLLDRPETRNSGVGTAAASQVRQSLKSGVEDAPHAFPASLERVNAGPRGGQSSEPSLAGLDGLHRRLSELEEFTRCNLVLTQLDKIYLSRVLGREGGVALIEHARAELMKDERTLRYYLAMQQVLCWLFVGAQAYCSNLVKGKHNTTTNLLLFSASKIAGLVPLVGSVSEGAVRLAAGEVADYFDGVNAQRIARAGGTDGSQVAEGVARFMVFARKDALSKLPQTGGSGKGEPYKNEVAKLVKRDVGLMMKWVKGESNLKAIREDADFTGEGVVRRLVDAAKPGWAKTATPKPGVVTPPAGGVLPAVVVTTSTVATSAVISSAAHVVSGGPSTPPNVQAPSDAAHLDPGQVASDVARLRAEVAKFEAFMRKAEAASQSEALQDVETGDGQVFARVSAQDQRSGLQEPGSGVRAVLEMQERLAFLAVELNEMKERQGYYERKVDRMPPK